MPSKWNSVSLLLCISSWSDTWLLFFWHSLLLIPCSDLPNSWQLSENVVLPLWPPLYVTLSWMPPKLPSFCPLTNPNPRTVCRCSQKHALIPLDRENHFLFLMSLLSYATLPRRNVTMMSFCFDDFITLQTASFLQEGPCLTYLSNVITVHNDDDRSVAQSLHVK